MVLSESNSINESGWLILGFCSLLFHTLFAIPILICAIRIVFKNQNDSFFKSRQTLLIKIILYFSIVVIFLLRPIELIFGPLKHNITYLKHEMNTNIAITIEWITFITMSTSSFIIIQLYILRAWIYFFNIKYCLAKQDQIWEQTLYFTNYDNWYLNNLDRFGNVKFLSGIISIFSIIFVIILCVIRMIDSHSNGYIAVIFGFQCLLMILFIILSTVISNIHSVNDLFMIRNELKFDLITLFFQFLCLSMSIVLFWNYYEILYFLFLELTSLSQLIQSVMSCFWFYKSKHKYTKQLLSQQKSRKSLSNIHRASSSIKSPKSISSIATVSTGGSLSTPTSANTKQNKLSLWWQTVSNSNNINNINNNNNKIPQITNNLSGSINTTNNTVIDITPRSLKLEDVISDEMGFRFFIKFLSLSFSSENMLFIAEVMRFKNFIFMRGLVNYDDIGYYLDLPLKVIDYMWYLPEKYRNLQTARRSRKKRRSSMLNNNNKKRRSFSLARLTLNNASSNEQRGSISAVIKPKSAPAVVDENKTKFGFDSNSLNITESKYKRRIQWIDQQKKKKKDRKRRSQKKYVRHRAESFVPGFVINLSIFKYHLHRRKRRKRKKRSDKTDDDIMSDIDTSDGNASDIEIDSEDIKEQKEDDSDESITLNDGTPKITAISPKLLALSKSGDSMSGVGAKSEDDDMMISPTATRASSMRFMLNPIDINDIIEEGVPSDINNTDAELSGNELSVKSRDDDDFKIEDFFDGLDSKQINSILISPLEDSHVCNINV